MLVENNKIIHGLWIGEKLSKLELLCIQSFVKNGHDFWLWIYKPIKNIPNTVIVKDANEIIPNTNVFKYIDSNKFGHGKGSYAGFSDLFRYKLLYEFGGIWVDMDITCLKPFDFTSEYLFRYHHKTGAVGNILKCPKNAPIMHWCFQQTLKQVNAHNNNWMLPIEILNQGIIKYELNNNVNKISNEDSWLIVAKLLKSNLKISNNWYAIHWMNEEQRRLHISKNNAIKNSTLERIGSKYNILFGEIYGLQLVITYLKLSKIYYIIVNIKARIRWYWNLVKNIIK